MGGLIAQYNSNTSSGLGVGVAILFFLFAIALYVFFAYCWGLVFRKAGQPLWAGFVPIYNYYVTLKIIGRPGWWLILFFIPIVNIIVTLIVYLDLARSFGKGAGFGVGLFFLWFIFIPVLAFSDAQYLGPTTALGYPPPPGYPPPGYPPPGQWDAPK